MYHLNDYGSMMADTVRMKAYTDALRRAVVPGDVVVDIGTGTGIFALLACQYGAARVIAIEPNDCIQVAEKLAKDNGLLDRIEFIQDSSTKVSFVDKADVLISDLRGVLPLFGRHLPTLVDARKRLLKTDGVLIPKQDRLYVSVVEAPELYKEYSDVWLNTTYNLNLNSARDLAVNTWSSGRVSVEQVLTPPQVWGTVNYQTLESSDVQGKVAQKIVRHGVAHGLIVWFDADLMDGIGFSNAPECNEHAKVYGSGFFPFSQPVVVSSEDEARIEIQAVLVGDDYTWRWDTTIVSREGIATANFRQSTFYGNAFSLPNLHKRQESYIPTLNSEGLMEQYILRKMNGINSLEIIAERLMVRFPGQFNSLADAIGRVGVSSQKFTG